MAQVIEDGLLDVELPRIALPLKNQDRVVKLYLAFGFVSLGRQNKVLAMKWPSSSYFNCQVLCRFDGLPWRHE